jgi:PhnB protein
MNNTTELSPYLCFNGNCREAMEFYKSIFGGSLEVSTFGTFDSPSMPTPDGFKDKIMHSTLKGDVLSFMASDGPPDGKVVFGNSVNMALAGQDEKLLTTYFEGLSEGGNITVPLEKQMWGDMFGQLTDKFGINWMVNITLPKPAKN